MSIARHHAEWLSLLEVSGPFLTMPVLMRVFPQGLDAHDSALHHTLRLAYEEWADNQAGVRPDPAIHTQWVRWVLGNALEIPAEVLAEGQALPPGLSATFGDHGETLRPDMALLDPTTNKARLLVRYYPPAQDLDKPLPGLLWKATPATRMMELLRATDVRLGLVTNGERWMLVDAPRQETTGFASWYANLWLEEPLTLRSFRSLLGVRRFLGVAERDTIESLLKESATNQQDVTDQLGYQVRRAVEMLVGALDGVDKDYGRKLLAGLPTTELYEAAVTVMMRLVFLLSAEERELLLLGDPLYDQYYAASTLRVQLREQADVAGEDVLERRHDAWSRLLALFRVVYGGAEHPDMRLPAYGGRLFDPDRFPFLEGRAPGTSWLDTKAAPVQINNRVVLHLLDALQLLQVKVTDGGPAEARRLSFRSLDIEQIGHVYEGLLDHTARRAASPVLGLVGHLSSEPEIELSRLEEVSAPALLTFLEEQTDRKPAALKKLLDYLPSLFEQDRLRRVCDNDEALYRRVLPWLGLIRQDTFGLPVVITTGSVYVTTGSDRRSTGTHYTPRSLTEPIVQHALDPLVYLGPAQGLPKDQWQLRSADDILALTICDMAMGSGAFLVQACRYLSEKLVEAWDRDGLGEGTAPNADPEESLALARRLVSERCLYGVDKNPMAVEMAKLSLWLITLDRGRPFTFLDHALRHGDSLLGVSLRQLRTFSMAGETARLEGGRQAHFIEAALNSALGTARRLRHSISHLPDRDARDTLAKAARLKEADEVTAFLKLGADMLVAYALKGQPVPTELQLRFSILANAFVDAEGQHFTEEGRAESQAEYSRLRLTADAMLHDRAGLPRQPFHWPLEFPEVFAATRDEAGFHALIGNPPFMGGFKITGTVGTDYREYLVKYLARGKRGNADLCAYFFLRAGDIVREGGDAALIATNTIAQGDTREVGLEQLVAAGWTIPRAIPSRKWPGVASLEVAHIWLSRKIWLGEFLLDDTKVESITPFLTAKEVTLGKPYKLESNSKFSYEGSKVYGQGFVLEPKEASKLLEANPKNKDVILPYINAEDLNTRDDQSPSRYAINFFDWSLERAENYPECLDIVKQKVKPERQRLNEKGEFILRKPLPQKWWIYGEKRPALYARVKDISKVITIPYVSKYLICVWEPTNIIYSHMMGIVATDRNVFFTLLQNSFHGEWVNINGSTLETRLRYVLSDCFETFPFPEGMLDEENPKLAGLEAIGEGYYRHRQGIMTARQEGLTKTYNRFHNPAEGGADIARLRELHAAMDRAVAAAYGWSDLALGHDFHQTKQGLRYTISEAARREVLGRLLRLNHARHALELAAGLHDKGRKKGKATGKAAKAASGRMKPDAAVLATFNRQSPADNQAQTPVETGPVNPKNPGSAAFPAPVSSQQPRLFEVEPAGSLWQATAGADEVAWLGSVVTVREEGAAAADEESYILISQAEAGRGVAEKQGVATLSIGTPLGMRLLDRKVGDRVRFKGQDGQQLEFVVVRIGNKE